LEDPGIDRIVILKWIYIEWDGSMGWIDLAQNRDKCGNEPLDYIKCGEFLD
jgi:hypothetical protein